MYVILRILKHMALVDFVTLPTYNRVEQCAVLPRFYRLEHSGGAVVLPV